ncbi:hypothetical protein OH76DRAFT_1402766 [Lentinus brumalis]|uniref:Uncharacterized protein n=1 Tax=Lentinus brumalis TaxID=2498619 RepID=A0A371DCM8_9APHY|nr:hypothetical protein OH76DRAFT_1402766 [Polyporus brumalis]
MASNESAADSTSMDPPAPSPSASSSQAPASASAGPSKAKYPMPLPDFVYGGDRLRKMFPTRSLPAELNPLCVDCDDLDDLPLVWFGVLYDQYKLFGYARRRGWAVKQRPDDEEYDMLLTFENLVYKYCEKYGLVIQTREVWGTAKLLITLYSNRDIADYTTRHRDRARKTFKAMGYAEDEPQWYLDLDEEY